MLLRFYPLSLNNERFQMADNGFFSFKYPLNACYFCQTGSVASNKYLDYLLLAWHRALQWTTCTDDHAYTTGICVLRHILEAENYSSNTRTIPSIQSQLIGCLSGGSFCLSGGAFVCLAGGFVCCERRFLVFLLDGSDHQVAFWCVWMRARWLRSLGVYIQLVS